MINLRKLFLSGVLIILLPFVALAQSYTLEQVLSSPYPSELTSADGFFDRHLEEEQLIE